VRHAAHDRILSAHPNRNPHLNRAQIEQYLRDYLGVSHILCSGCIKGDDPTATWMI